LDGVLIEQVFVNLLDNIVKYTPPQTTVWITARAKASEVLASVADDGPGLPPGEEDLVFEKFHRGVSEGAIGGAGLGLAICRAIVQAHEGRIWAEPRLGGGVTFRLSLPMGSEAPVLLAEAVEVSS
jgi:two-component system sensor histidine kinase KdpD